LLNGLKIFLAILLGGASSWWMQQIFNIHAVLATAIVGLVATLIPKKYNNETLNYPSLIYLGSFVAMSSFDILPNPLSVVLASLLASAIYYLSKHLLVGIGGKLGTMAFIASFIMWWGRHLWR
jgi:hypothetical protein